MFNIFKKNEEINILKGKFEALEELFEDECEKNKRLRILLTENNIPLPNDLRMMTCSEFAARCNEFVKVLIEEDNNNKVMTKDEMIKIISDVTCKCPAVVTNSVDLMEEQYNKINSYHEFYEKYLKSTKSFGEAIDKIAEDWKDFSDIEKRFVIAIFTDNNVRMFENASVLFNELG
ncbi:MAG TPA: hypothetical protein IAC41_01425 [Candidatus Merdenecus merdavium]|nr:hypothetical protein [Candidatus Merdenecus merdavium]